MTELIFNTATSAPEQAPLLLLAHGAGVGSDSPFMERLAVSLAGQGVSVVRFEFPYMQKRRQDGRKRPPDRQAVLLEGFADRVRRCREEIGPDRALVVGGKSMGGRMASILATLPEAPGIEGVACFGYPFHPPGKPDRWRTDHFPGLKAPMAVFQGTRDPFGKPEELQAQPPLPSLVTVHWLEGGNHDLRPLKKQGLDPDALIDEAAAQAASFIHALGAD